MRALIQRVKKASVAVEGRTTGSIGDGLLVLAGVKRGDASEDCEWLAGKIAGLRVFPDDERRTMLADHGKAARGFPDVRANTVPAFALGDYEWILAFEADELHRIVDLMRHLRATEARLRPGGEFDLVQSSGVAVNDVMSKDVLSIKPDAPALEAATTMRKTSISCLPVVEDERLIGIVTESDFLEYAATMLADPGR